MKKSLWQRFILSILCCSTICGMTWAADLQVSAAISLKDILEKAVERFEKDHPETLITLNLAASGALRQQIEVGAPCDLFISASKKQIDQLEEAGLVGSVSAVVASNTLVLIRPNTGTPTMFSVKDLPKVEKIVIGNPKTVPAGEYAQQALEYFGLWKDLEEEKLQEKALQKKLILTEHVRQVLDYVGRGEVDAGIVYATDARLSDNVQIAQELPEESHEPILYVAAIPKDAAQRAQARQFLDFLLTENIQMIFETLGFAPIPIEYRSQ